MYANCIYDKLNDNKLFIDLHEEFLNRTVYVLIQHVAPKLFMVAPKK
jgi:hypothetical protein